MLHQVPLQVVPGSRQCVDRQRVEDHPEADPEFELKPKPQTLLNFLDIKTMRQKLYILKLSYLAFKKADHVTGHTIVKWRFHFSYF